MTFSLELERSILTTKQSRQWKTKYIKLQDTIYECVNPNDIEKILNFKGKNNL